MENKNRIPATNVTMVVKTLMSGKSEIKVVTKPELKSRTEEFCW